MRTTVMGGVLRAPRVQTAAGESVGTKEPWQIRVLKRALIPTFVVRLIYLARFRALVSGRAEVNLDRGAQWERGCVISAFTKIKIAGPFVLGHRVHIASGCYIDVDLGGVRMGDDAMIGPNCTILSSNYRYDRLDVPLHHQGFTSYGVTIGRNVWIGANSVVLDGARIGDNVIVSAGSVVSGEIPDNAIVQGNPAAVVFIRR